MADYDVEDLDTLRTIAEDLGINYKTLARLSEPSRDIDFPEAKKRLGKYKLYDKYEVKEWYALWAKISKNMNGGEHLNGTRTD